MDIATDSKRFYIPEIKKMRYILMICAILYTYGLHTSMTQISGAALSFAFPALYIISGYLVLRESPNLEKRLLRAIGRTALCFAILFAVYFGFSLLVAKNTTLSLVMSKRFWFDFIVFNICSLPVGSTIWYVQALLYAYIIIYVIYKLKLLRYDIYIAAFCLLIALALGEFSGFFNFNIFGHSYLGGNFLTRALPYILIGCFIDRKREFFGELELIHHVCIFTAGVLLSVGEYYLLNVTGKKVYVGHLLGMGIVAVSLCLFAFFVIGMDFQSVPLKLMSRFELSIPYFVSSPIYAGCLILFSLSENLRICFGGFIGIITLALSFLCFYIYHLLVLLFIRIKYLIKKFAK